MKTSIRWGLLFLVAVVMLPAGLTRSQEKSASIFLEQYVQAPDQHYRWEKRDGGVIDGCQWSRLHMDSQEWKGIPWKHVMWVIYPQEKISATTLVSKHALLHISGGAWQPNWPANGPDRLGPPGDVRVMIELSKATRSVVCVLQHVPFQPMFDGMVEDEIISKTFVEFMKTGDPSWPLLMPMVKAAVRGMDTCVAHARTDWKHEIEKFTIFGASKRGWTTWLTSSVDPRVDALAPLVIDVLNMGPQMKHQLDTWGKYSEQIDDYSSKGITEKIASPEGKHLLRLVDPYERRASILQPKLLIFGTNDRYWPVDACRWYWDDLEGQKYLLYTPNQGHGIKDMQRLIGSIACLHCSRCQGESLPKLNWEFSEQDGKIQLLVQSDQKPLHVRGWLAQADTKDFRDSTWRDTPMQQAEGGFSIEYPRNGKHLAVFGEFVFDREPLDAYFSTNLRVFTP